MVREEGDVDAAAAEPPTKVAKAVLIKLPTGLRIAITRVMGVGRVQVYDGSKLTPVSLANQEGRRADWPGDCHEGLCWGWLLLIWAAARERKGAQNQEKQEGRAHRQRLRS